MRTLLSAHAMELPAGDTPPEWVQLLPYGVFQGRDGRGPYRLADQAAAKKVIAATKTYQRGADLPVDYDHQALNAASNGKPAPASGWIRDLEARADGLWGRVEWTASATAQLQAREYRYFSPVFRHRNDGTVTRLVCGALTNLPNLELTTLASASLTSEEDTMDPEIAKELRAALGLPTDAPDDTLTAAAQALADKANKALGEVAKALGLTATATGDQLAAAAQSLATKAKQSDPDPAAFVPMAAFRELQDSVAAMAQQQATGRATSAVAKAKADGKVSPAMEGWATAYAAKDIDGFLAWASAAPQIVTPGRSSPLTPPRADGLTDEEIAVCSQLGLDPTTLKKEG